MATLLSIVQAVANELGLPAVSSVATNNNTTERQMLALLNREGKALVKLNPWPKLINLATITTVASTYDYAVPSDFDRLIDQTVWDRTNHWEMIGPETPQMDRWRRERAVSATAPRKFYRYIGGYMRVFPTPTVSDETLVYEYVSKNWCQTSAGVSKSEMTVDTDEPLIDDQLLTLGLKWRFLSAKGFDATVPKGEYDLYLASKIGSDSGGGPMSMDGSGGGEIFVDLSNAPDSGYAL